MTDDMQNALSVAKHYAGVAIRAYERGEYSYTLASKALIAIREARAMAQNQRQARWDASGNGTGSLDQIFSAAAKPSVYATISRQMDDLERRVCEINRIAA